MGFKNIFKKSKLGSKEGFYIVLFICLCIVAVTAVYISKINNPSKQYSEEPNEIQELIDEKEFVKNNDTAGGENSTTTMKKPDPASTNTSSTSTKKASAATKSDPAMEAIKLIKPIDGEIVKNFDNKNLQKSKTMDQWETHEGIDIACDMGCEVKAAADGKIIEVKNDDNLLNVLKTGMGMTVVIEHKDGIRTVYCNLSENVKVKEGSYAKKGDVIGVVGDTAVREAAAIEGSHLHFSVMKKIGDQYVTVDPMDYLK